jgi:hypothetical protein
MTTIRTLDISDRNYEKIRSHLTTVLTLSKMTLEIFLSHQHGSRMLSRCSLR